MRGRTLAADERGPSKRRTLHRLKLLCDSGAGLGAIAGPACAAARQLVGGDNGALFWVDEEGRPAGFYHETERSDLKDLFIRRFEELFAGPGPFNMLGLIDPGGPSIGRGLDPAFRKGAWQSNAHRLLCEPLGHRYFIDVRIEVAGAGRAVLVIWHKGERQFTMADAEMLRPLQALLAHAIEAERTEARWVKRGGSEAHFITDASGQQLIGIDAQAEALLMRSHLLSQNVPMLTQPRAAPAFSLILAGMAAAGAPARHDIAIANGRIVASAHPTRMLDGKGGEATNMFVSLSHEVSFEVLCIEHLATLPLSPLQMELALFGMLGGDRAECTARFGISAEALKKHGARILEVLGASRWLDLARIAEAAARA